MIWAIVFVVEYLYFSVCYLNVFIFMLNTVSS